MKYTVLVGSATYGETEESNMVFSFPNVNHMELVEDEVVLEKIIDIILFETGVMVMVAPQENSLP
jgi:hypothetical protein